jgi:hypothetical protein
VTDAQTAPDAGTDPSAGQDANGSTVDPAAAINRGKGLSLEAVMSLEEGSPARAALDEFKALDGRFKEAEEQVEALKQERLQAIRRLKDEHNVGFSAIAEVIGNTSSLVLYLYERAAGKTAKQIREESVASRLAKEATRTSDPNRKPARKQTPEEKAFRKQQREALRAFLEEQRRAAAERGEDTAELDAAIGDNEAEDAADA